MMEIGKNIYTYRTAKGLTQEALANLLHVSTAAVSKWENDISYPDISTLPILARIFDISIDELLHFEKELRDEEVVQFGKEMLARFSKEPFEEALAYVRSMLRLYPNSERLQLEVARLYMQAILFIANEQEQQCLRKLCEEQAEKLTHSTNFDIQQTAVIIMCNFYSMQQQPAKALEILQQLPKTADISSLECSLYMRLKDTQKAQEMLEKKLYGNFHNMGLLLMSMCDFCKKQKDMEKLRACLDLIDSLNEYFGVSLSITNQLYVYAAALQDEERTLRYLKRWIAVLRTYETYTADYQQKLAKSRWFSTVQLQENSLPKGAMKEHRKMMIEEVAQLADMQRLPEVQEYLRKVIETL